jgi:hypothetical protein
MISILFLLVSIVLTYNDARKDPGAGTWIESIEFDYMLIVAITADVIGAIVTIITLGIIT